MGETFADRASLLAIRAFFFASFTGDLPISYEPVQTKGLLLSFTVKFMRPPLCMSIAVEELGKSMCCWIAFVDVISVPLSISW